MGKIKKSNREFIDELSLKNPNIETLDEYVNKDADIRCRCKLCGNEWTSTPRKLLNNSTGTGCKNCSRHIRRPYTKRSKEQLQIELDKRGASLKIIGDYKGMTKKIEVECLVCGEIWYPRPDHLMEGHGCPKCGGAKKKDNTEFLLQLKEINNYIEVVETYTNCRNKLKCRCRACGHEWKATPSKLLAGNGCPNCDSRNKTSFSEQAIFYYIKIKYQDALGRFRLPDSNLEFDIFIPSLKVAIEYDGVYWHRSKTDVEKKKYSMCKGEGITLIRIREDGVFTEDADYIVNRDLPCNYMTLDKAIISVMNLLKCNNLKVDSENDAYDIREQFYTELKRNSLGEKYPSLANEWFQEKNGMITPFMISSGCNDKYWWKCSCCGWEWKTAVCDRTLAGKGCKKCANRLRAVYQMKSQAEFEEEIKEKLPDIEIIGNYSGTHEKIEVLCKKCGYKWSTYPSTLLRGRGCTKCYDYKKTNKKKTHEEFINEMAVIQPNLIFLEEYQCRTQKIRAKCKICNEEFTTRPADLLHGHYKKHIHDEKKYKR